MKMAAWLSPENKTDSIPFNKLILDVNYVTVKLFLVFAKIFVASDIDMDI